MDPVRRLLALAIGVWVLAGVPVRASSESKALRERAAEQIYNLDRDAAIETYRQAIAADPQDAAAFRGLASGVWMSITFRRGNMTVDDYLGKVTRPTSQPPPPSPEATTTFRNALDRALALARARLAANRSDPDAHYQVGAAIGLRASYSATVDGSALGAFRAAREAYEEHERVLQLDPGRKDAALIVGTYRYIVDTLSLPFRWVAYMAGFNGGREKGLHLVEEAAGYPGESQTDARLALVLMYNREKRYDDALKQLTSVAERYPRNRLVWLEMGSTNLRAGRPAEAERVLDEGMTRFAGDTRPRMFGEEALWHYKLGTARAWLGRSVEAQKDLTAALSVEGRSWVRGRAHLELGRLALKAGDRAAAQKEFQQAISLCDSDNDTLWADEARRLLK
jgi:tetratricopeptide (TPR) repeat protein